MAVQKISIPSFLEMAKHTPVLDVRSPGEYAHAHIPGAYSLPLFTDDERKLVGTAYKQQGREQAIKIGLDFFGVKMRRMVEEVEQLTKGKTTEQNRTVLVHCWRGGMRSVGVAWLLDLYGFKVYTLAGGYKVYRKWVLEQFEKSYPFHLIGGYTGSGKTKLLQELKERGHNIIDLESLAHHKGSAFGAMGIQPKQEMFENLLATELAMNATADTIYIEDESQRIGNLQIPMPLWYGLRKRPLYFIDVPFEKRLAYIVQEYGSMEREKIVNNIIRIKKRLGGLETKTAINNLIEEDISGCFAILLKYYDKYYRKSLENRENLEEVLNKIPCSGVDSTTNIQNLLTCVTPRS